MSPRIALCLVAALVCTASLALADPTILLDTFEDDTVGLTPGTPEVGTSAFSPDAGFLVAATASGHDLRTTCPAGDSAFAYWNTSDQESTRMRVSFRARIESGTTLSDSGGRIDSIQVAYSDGTGSIPLKWGDDELWRDNTEVLGRFSFATDYDVIWIVDAGALTTSLVINGVEVESGSVGPGIVGLNWFNTTCATATEGYIRTDQIRAVEEPVFLSGFDLHSPDEWTSYSPAAVPGDECPIPSLLGQGIDTPGTLDAHTGTTGDDSSCGSADTIDRWLLYTAQCTGTALATTCLPETEFDTVLAAYDGCGGSEVACNDDFPGDNCLLDASTRKSLITFGTVAGVTYPIRVSAYSDSFPGADAEDFAVRVECVPTP